MERRLIQLLLQSEKKAPPTLELREEPRKVDVEAAEPEAQGKIEAAAQTSAPKANVGGMLRLEPEANGNADAAAGAEVDGMPIVLCKEIICTTKVSPDDRLGDAPISSGCKVPAVATGQEAAQADHYKEALMHDRENHSAWCGLAALLARR